jgi:hypothetical protein
MADDLQKQGQLALRDVPALLKRGLDNNKITIKDAGPKTAYGHSAIASVDDDSPNTINIHDKAKFMGAAPFQRTAMLSHELTHRLMDNAPPTLQSKFAPINQTDPYGYDENNLKGKPITNFSGEQLARMVETNQAYQADPSISMARKQQVAAQYAPILSQLQQLPQATVSTDQSQQTPNTMNTSVNPPEAQFDAAPPVVTQPSGPTVAPQGMGGEADIEQPQGMGGEEDIEQPTTQQVNQSHLRDGIAGAGKQLLQTIVGDPSVASISPLAHAQQLNDDAELNQRLTATSPDQVAGKVAAAGTMVAAGGAGTLDSLISRAKSGLSHTFAPTDSINALHNNLGATMQKLASDVGVDVKPTSDIRNVVSDVADAVRAKAQEKVADVDALYSKLKFNARGVAGKFSSGTAKDLGYPENYSGFDEQIQKLTDKRTGMTGADNIEKRAAINKQIDELTAAKKQASSALDRQGLGGARDEADRLMKQADELDKLKAAQNRATFGPKPGQMNPVKFHQELTPLHQSGSLEAAVGPEHADDMMRDAATSDRMYRRASLNKKIAIGTGVAAAASTGVGGKLVHHAIGSVIP